MLREFVIEHRDELIERCRKKASKRLPRGAAPLVVDHGAPLFLQLLADVLEREKTVPAQEGADANEPSSPTEIGRAAARQGIEMMHLGFTIDQVVHDYGDICQAVTDLAVELKSDIPADEFRTLNRCLDNAIAEAVSSFTQPRKQRDFDQSSSLVSRLAAFSLEHQRLIEIAIHSFAAIRTGNVGLTGATGALHSHSLDQLQALVERSFSDILAPPPGGAALPTTWN